MKFCYYITYIITNPHINLGNTIVELNFKLNTVNNIRRAQELLAEAETCCQGRIPMILNWKKIKNK